MSNVVRTGQSAVNNATTSNTFGKSVASQAQLAHAAQVGSCNVGLGEALNIYRLEPIAYRLIWLTQV